MSERPQWCKTVECPFYRNSTCSLKNEIVDGWQSRKTRNLKYEEYNNLVQKDKERVLNYCDYLNNK